MGRTLVMGDIHGAHKALVQCLERSKFTDEDTLIQLGDVADGWGEVYECVEELLKIKNLIAIKGNHDDWLLEFLNTGMHPGVGQGGRASMDSYVRHCMEDVPGGGRSLFIPESHRKFFRNQHYYYKDDKERLFIHGGFNRHMLLKEHNDPFVFWWDRDLWHTALSYEAMQKGIVLDKDEQEDILEKNDGNKVVFKIKEPVSEVFIGHTTTGMWKKDTPMHAGPIWNLDTGSGFEGKLTIMDVDTHEYWQSDNVRTLYPDETGRGRRS